MKRALWEVSIVLWTSIAAVSATGCSPAAKISDRPQAPASSSSTLASLPPLCGMVVDLEIVGTDELVE
ncbi:MAG: hypothetical protein K1X74_03140 [Pirellulales bacterium]|nr:hypothetical protein [Pirellulales bacterium]